MVEHIRRSSEEVNSRAQALSGLSGGAYEGMEQQSGEITSMAGAVEEFSATSLNIADNMGATQRLAQENAQQTQIGRSSMEEASSSLEQIAGALNSTATVINTLGQRSQEIGGIVGVITSIAEQTNLLALNAAIEAARAGEAGRGFAVVADEVRNLAHRTQESAQQVQTMIEELQVGARESVSTMSDSQRHSQDSVEIANLAGERLNSVTQRIGEIDGMNQSVATATEEQTAVVESINVDITEINTLNQEGVENLQATLRACSDLEQQASRLKQLVGSFRI
jgi:methyl-accepting chemotaxis protein